jgi:hypothetical protein
MNARSVVAPLVRPALEELEPRLVLSGVPTPDHVVVVFEENHGYSQIIGSPSAPYLNALAQQGALLTNSFAIEHPSQPNYLDLFSGSNQGITDDSTPHTFSTPNLGGELLAAGFTFAGYSEDMPSVGYTGSTFLNYARKHNPWVDFTDIPPEDNLPFQGYFPTDYSQLPAVAFVVPNQNNDMHNGSDPATIQTGDQWLQTHLSNYVQWAYANNSLLILTFDEDNNAQGNHIATLLVGPMVQPGQYNEHVNHFDVLRTLEDMYGLPYAGASANARPITDVWVTPALGSFQLDAPAGVQAGAPFDITLTALDASGQVLTDYTGTVTFSSGDPYGASLPADYTFTAADQGVHTFSAETALYTAGTWDVTATDPAAGVTTSAFVAVTPAPAVSFVITAPANVAAGTPFEVTVTAVDPYGNTDPTYQGTVTFSTDDPDPAVVLPADYTFTADDQGVHTFTDSGLGEITLVTPGDRTLIVTDTSGDGITGSVTVTVTDGPAPRPQQRPASQPQPAGTPPASSGNHEQPSRGEGFAVPRWFGRPQPDAGLPLDGTRHARTGTGWQPPDVFWAEDSSAWFGSW